MVLGKYLTSVEGNVLTTTRLHYSIPERYFRLEIPKLLDHIAVAWMSDECSKWVQDGRLDWNTFHAIRSSRPSMPPILKS